MKKEEEFIKVNRQVSQMLAVLMALAMVLCIVETVIDGKSRTGAIVTCIVGLVSLGILAVLYAIKKDKTSMRYDLAFVCSPVMMCAFFNTKYSGILLLLLAINLTVILHHDKVCALLTEVAILVATIVVEYIKAKMGVISVGSAVLTILGLLAYFALWFVINKLQYVQKEEADKLIEENLLQKQEEIVFLNNATSKIENDILEMNQLASNMKMRMTESTHAVKEISKGSLDTAESVHQQTQLTNDISNMIDTVVAMTNQVQQIVNQAVESSNRGKDSVKTLNEMTNSVNEQIVQSADEMGQLVEEAENIRDITTAIQGISNSTNLLALNASIEAARAGEAGKGFAVVADEIRKLADETRESAQRIEYILSNFIQKIGSITEDSKQSVVQVRQEVEIMQVVDGIFNEIENGLEHTKKDVENLLHSCNSLTRANESVMNNITDLAAVSEEVASQSEATMNYVEKSAEESEKITSSLETLLAVAQSIKNKA